MGGIGVRAHDGTATRHGSDTALEGGMGRKTLTLKQRIRRFWQRVDTSAGPDGCWPFTTKQRGKIYVCWEDKQHDLAHRIAYHLSIGDIPNGLKVLQMCGNHACVNPQHLCLGTGAEAMAMSMERTPRTFVYGNGHPSTKLSDAQADAIRRRYASGGVTQAALADEYGVHYSHISLIVNGKRRQHAA
jgi:hypothetical protein